MNPLGTVGFEFVEFSAPTDEGLKNLKSLFIMLGFVETAKHKRKNVLLYQQGDIRFLVNGEKGNYFHDFAQAHNPCACAMAFRVNNAQEAFDYAVSKGAKIFDSSDLREGEACIPAIYGVGDSVLYFVDDDIYAVDFEFYEDVSVGANDVGLALVDHLTHNVFRGNMDRWAKFYEDIGNFREIRYFDIEGKVTGLFSRAMTSPCGHIRIPINESADDNSQIEEFLKEYRGEGIQHIALTTEDIYKTVGLLRDRGVDFLDTPMSYYDKVDERVQGHGEDVEKLRDMNILIDGAPTENDGILLQIFTQTVIGPIFFEIIQRKGNEGFGEGNFKALFESIEDDQIRRGVIAGQEG